MLCWRVRPPPSVPRYGLQATFWWGSYRLPDNDKALSSSPAVSHYQRAENHAKLQDNVIWQTPMEGIDRAVAELRARVATAEKELADLKEQLVQAQKQAQDAKANMGDRQRQWPLDAEEYERYGRQMILPEFGTDGESIVSYGNESD